MIQQVQDKIDNFYQAVADGLPRNIDEMRSALNDDDAWAQEFELKWLDEASAWLSYELIDVVEYDCALIENYLKKVLINLIKITLKKK